jgi:hypothetical protein
MTVLNFLPADLAESPCDFPWKGKSAHIGPPEEMTPLLRRFQGKTSCGCFALAAGIAIWGAVRLSNVAEIKSESDLFDATFLYMSAPDLLDLRIISRPEIPDKPKEVSAKRAILRFHQVAIAPGRWRHNANTPTRELFHLATLVRHVTARHHKPAFDSWLEGCIDRVNIIAPSPPRRDDSFFDGASEEEVEAYLESTWGEPLPPEILSREIFPEECRPIYDRFVADVDWSKNTYVRGGSSTGP